jgi:hypothetical protein
LLFDRRFFAAPKAQVLRVIDQQRMHILPRSALRLPKINLRATSQ